MAGTGGAVVERDARAELPCVWVTAGVLSYRPCERDFACEACPLYQALRRDGPGWSQAGGGAASGARPGADDAVARFLTELARGCVLHLDRAYGADGLWVEGVGGGEGEGEGEEGGGSRELRMGPDEFSLRVLQPVEGLVLPGVGVRLKRGAPCAWVSRGRLAITLRSPIAAEVVAVHPHPDAEPARRAGRRGERWWLRVRPRETPRSAGLLVHEALLDWHLGRVRAVREQLEAALAHSGVAAADGGAPERDLEAVLGPERYEAVVGTLFEMGG